MVREGGKSGSYLYQRADQGWPPPRPVDPVEIGHCCQNCRARSVCMGARSTIVLEGEGCAAEEGERHVHQRLPRACAIGDGERCAANHPVLSSSSTAERREETRVGLPWERGRGDAWIERRRHEQRCCRAAAEWREEGEE